jgi:amidase
MTLISNKESWQGVAAAKRAATLASIPAEWLIPAHLMPADDVLDVTTFPEISGFFTKEELEITAVGASEIVRQISKKIWTAEKVTLAFCKAAAVAHQLVCLTKASSKFSGWLVNVRYN